jgi:Protein of unknown function (DUF3617)
MKTLKDCILISFILITLAVFSTKTAAQIKPGLWEVTGKIQGSTNPIAQAQEKSGGLTPEQLKAAQSMPKMSPEMLAQIQAQMQAQMQAQAAKLPPEQRKAMEASMATMQNMSVGKDGSTALKVCMTKEMIENQQYANQNSKCTNTKGPMVGNTQQFSFSCTDPVSTGEGRFTFQSNSSYTGTLKIKSVQNGKTNEMVIENAGKFLDANCGSVKPMNNLGK